MFNYQKGIFSSVIIFSVLLTFTLFSNQKFIPNQINKQNARVEKKQESNLVHQDATISAQMNFNHMINQLQKDLQNITLNENELKRFISEKYPQIVSIQSIKPKKTLSLDHYLNQEQENTEYPITSDGMDYYKKAKINVHQKNYEINVKLNLSDIEKKQQLRMFTVTHLQNHRWKTVPTKYNSKKKLSRGIDSSLPDLSPNPEEKGLSHYIQNEVVIKFKKDTTDQQIKETLNAYKLTLKRRLDHTIVATCPKRTTKTLISEIENGKKFEHIEYVEPHFIYMTNTIMKSNIPKELVPNDSLYSEYQWNLPIINTEAGWEFTRGKEDVVIAVIDTGVDIEHPEFAGKIVDGYNVIDPTLPPMDDDGHGTHVAGVIAANTNNQEGIAGITWFNKVMPIKVLDQSGAGTMFDVAEGILWAVDHGAKVINMSLGNYAESQYLHDAIQYAHSKDVVIVAATGNDNTNELGYPAAYKEVIGVSAVDNRLERAEFSNYGDYVDVVAPGVNIASTYPNNQYAALSGTSMASPHVAALAGLIRAYRPELSNDEVIKIIINTATDLGDKGKDIWFGAGQINMAKALKDSINQEHTFVNWLIHFKTNLDKVNE